MSGPGRASSAARGFFQMKANERIAGVRSRLDEAEGISELTRREIRGQLAGLTRTAQTGSAEEVQRAATSQIQEIHNRLEQAREGRLPIFRSRQLHEQRSRLMQDRPGRRQTVLTR